MIRTIEDLLVRIVASEVPRLDAEPVTHPGTIGDMYEGLTEHLLRKALPLRTLHVVTGFAEDASGARSPQIDRMVVVGEGRSIPFTDAMVYDLDQILAVIEVKKSLYADDLRDGYDKLSALSRLRPKGHHVSLSLVDTMFRSLTRRSPSEDPRTMPPPWNVIYRALMIEAELPARILIGYHGYKSVTAFRKAVAEDLQRRSPGAGVGPNSMPSLVMNDRYPIVKNDGLPYAGPIGPDGAWSLMMSSRSIPPMRALLEVLWTRICFRFGEPIGLFGDDLELEPWEKLFIYRLDPSVPGWHVDDYRDLHADGPPRSPGLWEPVTLTEEEADVVRLLCEEEELDVAKMSDGHYKDDVVLALRGLSEKALVGPDPSKPSIFRLLTKQLALVVAPTGEIYAGDNVSGRFARWLDRRLDKA